MALVSRHPQPDLGTVRSVGGVLRYGDQASLSHDLPGMPGARRMRRSGQVVVLELDALSTKVQIGGIVGVHRSSCLPVVSDLQPPGSGCAPVDAEEGEVASESPVEALLRPKALGLGAHDFGELVGFAERLIEAAELDEGRVGLRLALAL